MEYEAADNIAGETKAEKGNEVFPMPCQESITHPLIPPRVDNQF